MKRNAAPTSPNNRLWDSPKSMNHPRPKVGVGVIIVNDAGKILVGKRKGSFAEFYSIPGGHLEMGETFEEAAKTWTEKRPPF